MNDRPEFWLLKPRESSGPIGTLEFWIPAPPKPWQRANVRVIRGRPMHFPNEKNASAQALIRDSFIGAVSSSGFPLDFPHEGPVRLRVYFLHARPKTGWWSGREKTSRPDMDNVLKNLKDALNGIAWKDDSQIVGAHVEKGFADHDGTVVVVEFFAPVPKPIRTRG